MLIDEAFCAFVLSELKTGKLYSLTWALALAQAEGNEHQAQAIYVKLRVEEFRREWQGTPLIKVPEGLAFGADAVFHNGRLIPYNDIVSITLHSSLNRSTRSFLVELVSNYHIIRFSKLCIVGVTGNGEDYEALLRRISQIADSAIIPRLAQNYVRRIAQLGETVTIAGVQIDGTDGIRSKLGFFQAHLPRERFYDCERRYLCWNVNICREKDSIWKQVSCKEADAVLLPAILRGVFGVPE